MKTILLMAPDLLFGVKIANIVKQHGANPRHARSGDDFLAALQSENPSAAVVDLNNRNDVRPLIQAAAEAGVPVFAFGSHIDTEGIKRARAAGARKVVANSAMAEALPKWLEREFPEDSET